MAGTAGWSSDALARGRSLRDAVPRAWMGRWAPAQGRDPLALLEASNRTRLADLVPVRHGRMSVSPLAYLRGTPGVMAADLATTPSTSLDVQCCGDAHLGNFGAYATPERQLVFDVNDFDETAPGPWEWDLKRLVVSVVVAARSAGMTRADARTAARSAAESYRARIRGLAAVGHLTGWYDVVRPEELLPGLDADERHRVEDVIDQARRRTMDRAVQKLTVDGGETLRIRDQPPLITHVEGVDEVEAEHELEEAHAIYLATLAPERRLLLDRYRVVDFARKVVGVGSVGTRCYVWLLRGRGKGDNLFLQVKEAQRSVVEQHHRCVDAAHAGERVVVGQRIMQAASDPFLGWTSSRGRHYFVRQLWDMKAHVDVLTLTPRELASYGALCGWTLARAHARSTDAAVVAAYLGQGDRADRALVEFAERYADTIERDYEDFLTALRDRHLEVELGV